MINEEKLDNLLLELGYDDFCRGTAQLRTAVKMWEPGMKMTGLYAAVAKRHNTTPSRTERAIRHVNEKVFFNADLEPLRRCFGGCISRDSGKMANGQVIARLARVCRED